VDADSGLVEAAARGSREAFDELVRRYQGPVVNLARALTGGGRGQAGNEDAEDLAQEVFVRAWRGLGGFRGDSTFRTWLHRVAINVIQSHRGRASRLRRLFQAAPAPTDDEMDDPIESAADPDDMEQGLLLREAIDKALAVLPEELRLAVTLRDVQGLDYRAISDLTGAPIGTVESRIFRARQRLKQELAGSCRGSRPKTAAAGKRGRG
jgi:RNA polymerase sigma-70 factor (ECF subfamily)